MQQRELRRIDTNGVTLETVVEGDGPLVILLHGWPQCWYLWRHQIDPIVEADRFLGVVVANLTFDVMVERYIAPFKPPGNGHIFLVDGEGDAVWSSDPQMVESGLVGSRYDALENLLGTLTLAGSGTLRGDSYRYTYENAAVELIAYAPIDIGAAQLVLGVRTPAEVARQSSFANFQSQQLVAIL